MSYRLTPEIAASQAEYAARKWAAHVYTNSFSCTNRFHRFSEAVAYVRTSKAYALTNDPRQLTPFFTFIEGPGGKLDQATIAQLITAPTNDR